MFIQAARILRTSDTYHHGPLVARALLLCGLILLFAIANMRAQDERDYLGREFFLCFPPNIHKAGGQSPPDDSLYIYISSDRPTTGRIEFSDREGNRSERRFSIEDPNLAHVESFAYSDYELQGYNLNGLLDNPDSQNETVSRQVFYVVADRDISVYGLNHAGASSDGFMALPADVLDGYYVIPAFPSDTRILDNRPAPSSTPSQFAVVALNDNTDILIQTNAPVPVANKEPIQITLQRGQCYLVQSRISVSEPSNDLTGSVVISDKPLAVFAGHQRSQVPGGDTRNAATQDHIIQQVAPVSTWGKQFSLAPLIVTGDDDGVGNDIVQIVAAQAQTRIYINGAEKALLDAGQSLLEPISGPLFISSDEPIHVTHLRHSSSLTGAGTPRLGDPFALSITPKEQWLDKYTFSTAQAFSNLNREDRLVFEYQYLMITLPTGTPIDLALDGVAVSDENFTVAPFGDFLYANIPVTTGRHVLQSTVPFGAHVYGFGEADSYAFPAGAAHTPINLECSADAGPDITVCRGDTVMLNAVSIGFDEPTFRWSPAEDLISSPFAKQLRLRAMRTTWYKLLVRDERGCRAEDSVLVTVTEKPQINAGSDHVICPGESVQLGFEDPGVPITRVRWTPADKVDDPASPAPIATPGQATGFIVEVETASGCVVFDTVVVNVRERPVVDAGPDVDICEGSSAELTATGGVSYEWRPADGLNRTNIFNPIAKPEKSTKYFVRVTDAFGCVNEDSVTVFVSECRPCESISGIINEYASVVALDYPTRRVRVVDGSVFAPGDLAMIVQMQGAEINVEQAESYGRIENPMSAGAYELVRIDSISLNLLSLNRPIHNQYDPAGKVQVVKIPEYDHVTVVDRVFARPWDGNVGGVVAMAANCLIVEDTISVDTSGFRGGRYEVQSGCRFEPNTTAWVSDQLCRFSYRGEGTASYGVPPNVYGRGAPANGGGGGNNHNAGGGGGGNGGAGGKGGNGFRNFANWDQAGGVGGYPLSKIAAADTSGRLFMGGGGGAGHVNHTNGSGGARGGGIVYIRAGTLRSTPNSLITARGQHAANDTSTLNPDGCGGGGAGGTIMLHVDQILEDVELDVRGGNGGTRLAEQQTTSGPGGGGGGGLVLLSLNIETNDFEIFTHTAGGAAGELGLASGNNYGAAPGLHGAIIDSLKGRGVYSQAIFGPCRGCYPVRKATTGGCGSVEFDVADANFEIVSIELDADSDNVSMETEELNSLRVGVEIELDDPLRAGNYVVYGRNSNGKESIFRGTILPEPPMPELSFRNDSLFINSNILPRIDSIQWYSEERGALIQRTADRLPLVDSGVYWVQVWNEEGCSAFSERYNFNAISSVMFPPLERPQIELNLFPNPADNLLTIRCRTRLLQGLEVQISDVFGRIVWRRALPDYQSLHEIEVDLDRLALAPGGYSAGIVAPGYRTSQMFIKQP